MMLSNRIRRLLTRSSTVAAENQLTEHYPALYRLAYAWCHQPTLAQDLVQETLLKALETPQDWMQKTHLKAWLIKIMRNQFLDGVRQQQRWEWADVAEIDQQSCVPCCQTQLEEKLRCEQLYLALARLPFIQREVILLADLQGFSYQEIAQIVEVPVGTVMSRLARGREQLKQQLMVSSDVNNATTLNQQKSTGSVPLRSA
ncbi:MAG: RNA polymerase sigma factor [Thiotrichales bacterium]|nr:RNA polymerase sigma factor [Thiotrichales bacterium]